MSENPAKGFKVPKIRKESKDGLREVDVNSRDAQEITNLLQRSYIESSYKSQWELKTVQYVQNRDLEERYRQKRSEMKDEGRNTRDLGEQYTFMLLRDGSMVPSVVKEGLKCRSLPFNALGNSKLGLYLSRNADVQLRLAEKWEINTCKMLIFKITPGKCKVCIGGQGNGEGIEPTPNYDCHVSQYQPRSCDPIHLQLARSQIYLYEYTEDCEPSETPRHCLPYAVLTYQKSHNKSQTTQSDSYSKRPASVTERLRNDQQSSDTDLSSKVDSVNLADPRIRRKDARPTTTDVSFIPQDPRLGYVTQQSGDAGLCVPRLTPGPPPSATGPAGTPGLVWQNNQGMVQNPSGYLPSFGPQFESNNPDNAQLQTPVYQPNSNPSFYPSDEIANKNTFPPNDPRLRRTDPRLNPRIRDSRYQKSDSDMRPSVNNVPRPALKPRSFSGDNSNKSRKKLSLNDYKQKVGIQPTLKSETNPEPGEDVDEMYDPTNPSIDTEFPYATQTTVMEFPDKAEDNNDSLNALKSRDEAVDNPDDMMKALNELPDPDDGSQSPKTIANEVEEEDPILAAAMRKLVEHSGDVSLFTEALRRLQESAEEIGDALHDPAFLVKAIAENVESLTKSKFIEKQTKEQNEDKFQSSSEPPTGLTQTKTVGTPPTKTPGNENVSQIGESPMARAMKLTLEELQRTEKVVTTPSTHMLKGDASGATDSHLKSKVSELMDLSSIPIPDYSPQKPKVLKDKSNFEHVNVDIEAIPLPETKPALTDSSDDVKETNRPGLSFSLKQPITIDLTNSSQEEDNGEFESIQDKDERKHSKTVFVPEQNKLDQSQNTKTAEMFSVNGAENLDTDYRVQENDRYLGYPINCKGSFELSEKEIDIPKNSISVTLEDKDERASCSTTHLMDTDERQNPPASSGSVNQLLDKDERQLLSSTHEGRLNAAVKDDVNMLDKDEWMKPDPHGLQDPSSMDRDERQPCSQSSSISQVFLNVQDPCELDKDERSLSRSGSPPTVSKVFMDIEDPGVMDRDNRLSRSQSPSQVSKAFIDLTDENLMDRDTRSHSRSQSPSKLSQPPSQVSKAFIDQDQDQGLVDRDERHAHSRSQSPSNISKVFMDIEDAYAKERNKRSHLRSQSPSKVNEITNSQDQCLTDKDDRIVSGDQFPSNLSKVFMDIEDKNVMGSIEITSSSCSQLCNDVSQDLKNKGETSIDEEEVRERLELQNIDNRVDLQADENRIRSRSSSPLSFVEEAINTEVKIIPLHNLDGSESSSDSQGLFDAYAMGKDTNKKKKTKEVNKAEEKAKQQIENELGDVDWRLAAEAAEMGDIDLRSSKSVSSQAVQSGMWQSDQLDSQLGLSKSDLDEPQSVLNQDVQQDLQLKLFDGDMRTFGDLKDSQGLSERDPRTSQSGLSQSDPRIAQSGLTQRDPRIAQSGLSQCDPRPSQSGLSQSDPRIAQSGLSQSDPRGSHLGLSQGEEDIDLRASDSDLRQPSSNIMGPQNPPHMHPGYGGYPNNSYMQPMFGGPQEFPMRPAGSYSTNIPGLEAYTTYKAPIPSYSTSSYGGEYRSSGFQGRTYGDQYSYSTGSKATGPESYWSSDRGGMDHYSTYNRHENQAGPPPPNQAGGLQNIMNNLDFSSLKNILAVVQNPAVIGGSQTVSKQLPEAPNPQQPDAPRVQAEPDEEEENQPAFCTGLSFLRSKQPKVDMTRAKYTGKAILRQDGRKPDVPSSGVFERHPSMGEGQDLDTERIYEIEEHMQDGADKQPKIPGFNQPPMEQERSAGMIPGFGSSYGGGIPGLGMLEETEAQGTSKPFTFSEDIPDRDISSQWYEEIPGKEAKKSEKLDGKSKSPKKKSKRNRNESSGTDYADTWQNAILESMEESALAVKSEDNLNMDTECGLIEPELKSPVHGVHKLEEGKRALDDKDTETDTKRHKPDLDSDDEDNGLVIDLDMSQTSKESSGLVIDLEMSQASKESEEPVKDVITIDDSNDEAVKDSDATKDTEGRSTPLQGRSTPLQGRSTPLQDEHQEEGEVHSDEEGGKKELEDLEDDAVGVPNIELKTFIEKKRKNIVIKLKGQTKKVNPKTGKAYTEDVVGSAIEVLGQPKKSALSAQNTGQQIHPIRGIESLGKRREPHPSQFQGSSISTLINRSSVPPAVPNTRNYNQQSPPVNAYTHPYTGQKLVYPTQPPANISHSVSQAPPNHNQYTGTSYHGHSGVPISNISHPTLQGQILVLPGQGRPLPGNFGMSIPTLGAPSSQVGVRSSQKGEPSFHQGLPPPQSFQRNQSDLRSGNDISEKNYEFSRTNANKYIKMEENLSALPKDSNIRKRNVNEISDSESQVKKIRMETTCKDSVVKVLTDSRDSGGHEEKMEPNKSNSVVKVLMELSSQKVIEPSSSGKDDKTSEGNKQESVAGDDSELEDGEISDDDCEIIPEQTSYRENRRGNRGRRFEREFDDMNDYPHYDDYDYHRRDRSSEGLPHRAASQWSDMLHHPDAHMERTPRNRSNPRAIADAAAKICEEATSVLSQSAATFSKAKQKILARTQVRTLGDWLKVELEIENIEPLQNIIPYSLSTDLSIIPKPRRRKIRFKVKNAIEEEGNRQSKYESKPEEQQSTTTNPPKSSPLNPSYAPEVSHEQIERELKMVRDVLEAIKQKGPLRRVKPVMFRNKPLVPDSFEETKFAAALSVVEVDMMMLLSRSNYFGYPHRRVPQEVLLESETGSFRSEFGDVFLILMSPISIKAYNKLWQFKKDLEKLYKQKEAAKDNKDEVEEEIKSHLLQRQNTLRAFTGYLNKKRITKLQEHTDNFKMVYEYFKSQLPPFPDATLRFIKTSQKDLAQHLLVAKQYLSMEDKKLDLS